MKRMNIHAWGHSASVRKWCADATTDTPSSCHARWLGLRMLMLTLLLSIAGGTAWAVDAPTGMKAIPGNITTTIDFTQVSQAWQKDTWITVDAQGYVQYYNSKGEAASDAWSNQNCSSPYSNDMSRVQCLHVKKYEERMVAFQLSQRSRVTVYGNTNTSPGLSTPRYFVISDNKTASTATKMRQAVSNTGKYATVELAAGTYYVGAYEDKADNNMGEASLYISYIVVEPILPTTLQEKSDAGDWNTNSFNNQNYFETTTNTWSTAALVADNTHGISVNWKGFHMMSKSSNSGYVTIRPKGKGTVKVKAEKTKQLLLLSNEPLSDNGTWSTHRSFEANNFQEGDILRVYVSKLNTLGVQDSGEPCVQFFVSNNSWDNSKTGNSNKYFNAEYQTENGITTAPHSFTNYEAVDLTIGSEIVGKDVIVQIFGIECHSFCILRNSADNAEALVTIQDNTTSWDSSKEFAVTGTNNAPSTHERVFNDNESRYVYVGATDNVYITSVAWEPITINDTFGDDLEKLATSGNSQFGFQGQWETSGDIKSNTLASRKKIGIIADENHYVTLSENGTFQFNNPLDWKNAFLVIEPQGPGWLEVTVAGDNEKYAESENEGYKNARNKISITTSLEWDNDAESATVVDGNWKVTKAYTENPGRLYIAAFDGQTITFVKWVPYVEPTSSMIPVPSFKQNGTIVTIKAQKRTNITGYNDYYYIDNYINFHIDNETGDAWVSGYNTDKNTSPEVTIPNSNNPEKPVPAAETKVRAKHTLCYKNPAGKTEWIGSEEVTFNLVPTPLFSVKSDGSFELYNYNGSYTYYYTTDGSNPTKHSQKLEWETKLNAGHYDNVKLVAISELEDYITPVATVSDVYVASETDCTDMIANADYSEGNGGWAGTPTVGHECAEKFNCDFDVYQDLEGLQPGVYRLTVNAFNRTGATNAMTGDAEVTSFIYMDGYAQPVVNLKDQPIPADRLLNGSTNDYFNAGTTEEPVYYPDRMSTASKAFADGYYLNTMYGVVGADGKLRIGIRGIGGSTDRWTCWDNFTLTYLGAASGSSKITLGSVQPVDIKTTATITATVDGGMPTGATIQWMAEQSTVSGNGETATFTAGEFDGTVDVTAALIAANGAFIGAATTTVTVADPLLAVTGSYIWNYTSDDDVNGSNGNFGSAETYSKGDAKSFYVDGNHMLFVPTYDDKNRPVQVLDNGRIYLSQPNSTGLKIKIPGPGLIRMKAQVESTSNASHIDFITKEKTYAHSFASKNTSGIATYQYEYTDEEPATVFFYFGGGSGNEITIEEIQYISLPSLTAKTEPDNSATGPAYHWSGRTDFSNNAFDGLTNGKGTYANSANNHWNTIRILADETHTIKVNDPEATPEGEKAGFTFNSASDGTSGYIMLPATVAGKVTIKGNPGDHIYVGTSMLSGDEYVTIGENGEYTYTLFTNADNRMVYIGTEAGNTIEEISWLPGVFTAVSGDLIPVHEHTVWEQQNYFGGCDMNATGNTPISENRLNNGRGSTPARTLLIHSDNGTKGYFNTSHNISFYNSTADQVVDDNIVGVTRMVEFKVRGKGTVLVQAAGSGPTGRTVNISTNGSSKEALAGSSIMTEAHDKYAADGTTLTANEQEHTLDMVRHQWSSYHAAFAYYDGPEGVDQSIYVWLPGGGANIQHIEWFPGQTINDIVKGDLSPEGCLTITDVDGNPLPETIYLRPSKTGETDHDAMFDGTTSYNFYAKVVTDPYTVGNTYKEPVWTNSTGGRKGFEYKDLISAKHDEHTGFQSGKNVSEAHTVTVPNRTILASTATNAARTTVPGWGIVYIVAGTWEGDRADMRRLEIAGPATGLDIENNITVINLKKGQSVTVDAIPYNESIDNEYGVDNDNPHGIMRRMSTIDRPEDVTWTMAETAQGAPTVGNETVVADKERATVTAGNVAGTYLLTVSIDGVRRVGDSWVKETYTREITINVADDRIFLERIQVGDEKEDEDGNITDYGVTDPIVYRITGDYDENTELTINLHSEAGTIPVTGHVKTIDGKDYMVFDVTGKLKQWGMEHMDYDREQDVTFVVTGTANDGATKLDNNKKNGELLYTEYTVVKTDGEGNVISTKTIKCVDADNNPMSMTADEIDADFAAKKNQPDSEYADYTVAGNKTLDCNYNFTFTTEKDDPGTELETFVYNVSQRGQASTNADLTKGGLLSENKNTVPYTATAYDANGTPAENSTSTESWYCNHRSYIKVENFETGVNKSDASDIYLNSTTTGEGDAATTGTITISPYNTNFGKTDKEEAIAGIDITIDENSAANGTIKFYVKGENGNWVQHGEPVTVTNGTVSFADCTFTHTDGQSDWVHDVKIVVSDGVKIDQIKIDYYSAHRTPLIAKKTFESYNAEKFQGNISNGLQMQGADGNDPEIKIAFRQSSDTRHFALREQWSRYAAEDNTGDELKFRGEKQTRNRKQTVMIMRDDKTDPCEMYIYTNNMVANIMSVELIYETDNDDDQNGFDARSVFCTSDPRYNTAMDVNANIAGWPLKDMELADGDYTEDKDANTLRKLVYTPESPVSFASFVMNCNEPGYVFVRKILVRYDANCNAAPYKLNDPNMNGRYNKSRITSVAINTNGIQIGVPKVGNEAEAYLIKRTSTQNNIAKEIVLNGKLDEKALDLDYNGVTLNDNVTGAATDFKHKKFYTVYALDKERMMIRQLAFRTEDNEKPVITRDEVKNSEFRSEEPLTKVPNQITITVGNSDGHEPGKTIIVYTTDGSAPSVTFGGNNGRKVTAINGEIGYGTGVTFDKNQLTELFAADNNGIKNSIVIKALALPLNLGTGETAPTTVSELKALDDKTFGEVSAITRANYTLLDQTADEKFFTTARRDANNNVRTHLGDNNPYDITANDISDFAGVLAEDANTNDKFHGAYRPMATGSSGPAMMTYGGFELYKSDIEADHKFDHTRVKNDFWQVKANDLNPWRGVSGVVAGDAYVVSNIEPFNENATYKNSVIDASEFTGSGDIRYFKGQFDKSKMDAAPAYAKTWQLPTYGDYFQYEPKDNGTLTVYVKQQGVLDQEGYMLDDELLRFRPVFIYDEAGNTPAGITASTASKVGGDWMTMKHTNNSASKYLTSAASDQLVAMCQAWIDDNTSITENGVKKVEYGDRAYKTQGVMNLYGRTTSVDGYTYNEDIRPAFIGTRGTGEPNGFMLISEGYVKYEFPVQAGKSYFMFAANGNLGMCSYTFKKESAQSAASAPRRAGESTGNGKLSITLPGNVESGAVGQTADVTLNRAFAADTWAAIVLPFSVGKHELRNVFGDGVQVIHFTEMQSKKLHLTKHIHQMLVAGVPAFIRPTQSVPSGHVFKNVTIETHKVQEITAEVGGYNYKCTGSYNGGTIPKDGWYISGGSFSFRTNSAAAIGGTRSWIEPMTGSNIVDYQKASISFRRFVEDDTDDSEATGISIIGADASTGVASRFLNNNVYSVDGRLVRQNTTSLRGLPAGVYIVNGEKHIVK